MYIIYVDMIYLLIYLQHSPSSCSSLLEFSLSIIVQLWRQTHPDYVKSQRWNRKDQEGLVTSLTFHGTAKIGNDLNDLTNISTWFSLDVHLISLKPSPTLAFAHRREGRILHRYGGTIPRYHDTTRPWDAMQCFRAESRCRAQAFRNAQFEPLPEPSRKEQCWHVLTCIT